MTDEEKNTEIIEKLKNLPKIKTGEDFMLKLENRIAEFEIEKNSLTIKSIKKEKEGFFQKLFNQKRNQWLVPAMGLTAVAIFALYITKFNNNDIGENSEMKNNTQFEKSKDEEKKDNSVLTMDEENSIKNKQKESDIKTGKGNITNKVTPSELKSEIENTKPGSEESKKENNSRDEISSKPPETSITGKVADSKKEKINNYEKSESKAESFNDGKTGMESPGILTSEPEIKEKSRRSSEEDMKEFDKPVEKSILDKLNKVNKQKLDSLKKKINK